METFLIWIDPVLVLPFRVIPHPETGYIFGMGCLALMAVILGLVTLSMANRLHARRLKKYQDQMQHYHKLGEQAPGVAVRGLNGIDMKPLATTSH